MSDERRSTGMFEEPAAEKRFPATAVAIAAVAVAVLLVVLVMLGRRPAANGGDATAYAPSLALSGIQMSEADSLSGGKSTYVDGTITNNGPRTVTGVTVAVTFANDQAMPPQVVTVPLSLIRMREPYVDVAPVRAAPIGPGAGAAFRLIFENVNDNWNLQVPAIRVVQVTLR